MDKEAVAKKEAAAARRVCDTTQDAFLGGRLHICQPVRGPRAGIDAVFLAAAARAQAGPGERALEAGSGAGVVALALAWGVPGLAVTGIEIEPALAALATDNARQAGLAERVRFVEGDVTAPLSRLATHNVRAGGYNHVLANPPFFAAGTTRMPRDALTRRAHHAADGGLENWLRALAAFAAPRAMLSLIHRAEALGDILRLLERRFGGARIFPLFPSPGAPASRIIIQARKASRAPLRLLPGMVLHRADGGFTERAEAVLRHGEPLRLD